MSSINNSEGRCNKCNETCEKCKEPEKLYPDNLDLPFFAYGLFKNGELGFNQIKEFVKRINYCEINGKLYERDGIPLFDYHDFSKIKGQLIFFKPGKSASAYGKIAEMEPGIIYEWKEISVNEQCANILHGIDIDKGSYLDDRNEWSGKNDPYFSRAIDVIISIQKEWGEEKLRSLGNFDYEPQLRLQMAYMLLWASIERYATLKYKYKGSIHSILKNLDKENAFINGLKLYVKPTRKSNKTIYSSSELKKYTLNPDKPNKAWKYYYQVRCNSTHRGKSAPNDFYILKESLEELLNIFRLMLNESFEFDDSFFTK